MSRRTVPWRTLCWWAAAAAWMVVIFLFSAQRGQQSAGVSDAVVHLLQRLTGHAATDVGDDTLRFVVRKCGHATEYFLLGALLTAAWRSASAWTRTRMTSRAAGVQGRARRSRRGPGWLRRHTQWWAPWLIAVAYAASDETHQLWVPGRSGQVRDVVIDAGGGALGVMVASVVARRRARR